MSKLALLGNADASATVEWFLTKLRPEAIVTDEMEDAIKRESDIKIMSDPRYIEIFRMVDYSICGVETDENKPYSKSMIIRQDGEGRYPFLDTFLPLFNASTASPNVISIFFYLFSVDFF